MASSDRRVAVAQGIVRGHEENGVDVFRGVPYATAPVGKLRLRSPQPAAHWDGERDATRSGPASYQTNDSNREHVTALAAAMNLGTAGIPPRPDYSEATYSQQNASEDCLYLDIWVPRCHESMLPVYVYYHGGANASSSGHNPYEDASNLCREEQIIVIRPTYREGFLGWGHFGLVTDLFPEAVNLGLQDQIAALQWVADNIEAFGGDPANVTVGGESAGATAVSGLLTYPPTQPLIRRAILQSFSPFHAWCTQEKQDGVAIAELFLQLLEIDDPARLATLDPDYFLAAHSILVRYFDPDKNGAWSPVGPIVDGNFVPRAPARYLSEEKYPRDDFELMLGFAKDEWQYSRGQSHTAQHGSAEQVKAVFAQVFGNEGATTLFDRYRTLYPDHAAGHILGDVMSFEFFKFAELAIARNFAGHGFSTHVFQFSLDLPGYGGFLRAVHTGDMPIIFRNLTEDVLQHFPGFDGLDRGQLRDIATRFGRLYGNFIRSGDPGTDWPRFESGTSTVLWLGEQVQPRPHLLDGEWDAFHAGGITDVAALQKILVTNTRRALNNRERAFAVDNGAPDPPSRSA